MALLRDRDVLARDARETRAGKIYGTLKKRKTQNTPGGQVVESLHLCQRRSGMEPSLHAEHEAFRQHFRTLTAQLQAIHAAWEETAQAHDPAHQAVLIQQEQALLTEGHALITPFQARMAEQHQRDGRVVGVEPCKKDPA